MFRYLPVTTAFFAPCTLKPGPHDQTSYDKFSLTKDLTMYTGRKFSSLSLNMCLRWLLDRGAASA